MTLKDYLNRITTASLISALILTSQFDSLRNWHFTPKNKSKGTYITAFGPWYGKRNPSEDFVIHLSLLGYETEVLPVEFQAATSRLLQIIAEKKSRTIISLGEGSTYFDNYFEVNVTAQNLMIWGAYGGPVNYNSPDKLSLSQDSLSGLINKFEQAGIKYDLRQETGTYVCNALFFTGLEATRGSSTRVYFFHVPGDIYSNKEKRQNLERAIESITR